MTVEDETERPPEPRVRQAEGDDGRHRFWCSCCKERVERVTECGHAISRGAITIRKVRLCDVCLTEAHETLQRFRDRHDKPKAA